MKKKILLCAGIFVLVAIIVAGIFGTVAYLKNREIKQRQEAVANLQKDFSEAFENCEEMKVIDTLNVVYEKYPEKVDSFSATFKTETEELILNREKETADFLNRLNTRMSAVDNYEAKKLSKKLNKLIEDNFENMLLAQLKGRWRREDSTDLSGTVITVNVSREMPAATITDISNAVNNQKYFKVGDVKWNYIYCIDKSVFTFTDMWKTSEFDMEYNQARGVYNYETDSIDVWVDVSEGNGISQHLVRDTQVQ